MRFYLVSSEFEISVNVFYKMAILNLNSYGLTNTIFPQVLSFL